MKDRLITLGGAMLALIMVIGMFTGASQQDEQRSLPASSDQGRQGYYAAREWLAAQNIPATVLRERYNALSEIAAGGGHLLIIPYPQPMPARHRELQSLAQWLDEGNSVLLSLHDHSGTLLDTDDELFRTLGIQADHFVDDEAAAEDSEHPGQSLESSVIRKVADHPVLRGIGQIETQIEDETAAQPISHKPVITWNDQTGAPIPLLRDLATGQAVLAAGVGDAGRVWLLRHGTVFANGLIGKGDNARLLANLVRLSRTENGSVIFDDLHQGDSTLYDPEAFYSDPRLYSSLGFLLMIWLLWLIGYSNRVAPPRPADPTPGQDAFMRAVGRLYARRQSDADTAKSLLSHFFNHLRRRHRLPVNGEPCWELLGPHRNPRGDARDITRLQALHNDALQRKKVDLFELHNLTRRIKEALI